MYFQDVGLWLEEINLGSYRQVFKENGVNGEYLESLSMFTTEQILRFIRRCHMKWGDFITLCKELRRIKGSNLLFLIKDFLRLCMLQVCLFMCDHTCQQGICASSKLLTKCMPWLKIRTATHPVGCELMCTSGHVLHKQQILLHYESLQQLGSCIYYFIDTSG